MNGYDFWYNSHAGEKLLVRHAPDTLLRLFLGALLAKSLIPHLQHCEQFFFGPFAVEILRRYVPIRQDQFVYFGARDVDNAPIAIISFRVPTVVKKGCSTAMI